MTNKGNQSPFWGTKQGKYMMHELPIGYQIIGISICVKLFKHVPTNLNYVNELRFNIGMVYFGEYGNPFKTNLIGISQEYGGYPFEWASNKSKGLDTFLRCSYKDSTITSL